MPAKRPAPRLEIYSEDQLNDEQRALVEAIRSSPRGRSSGRAGPFAVWMHAPAFGDLAQQMGAHCRYRTVLQPRLAEFAILCTARMWRAQYEWFAHAPLAEKAGVKPQTIADLRAGRPLKRAAKDERAIYEFVKELYKTRRVKDRTYARVRAFLDDRAMVELVGILGYYTLISMALNIFRMLPQAEAKLPFSEPGWR